MKQVFKIDYQGFYLEPVILRNEEKTPSNCVEEEIPEGLFKAKFVNGAWIEGLSQIEKDAIVNKKQPKSEVEVLRDENKRLEQQLAQTNENLEGLMNYLAETGVL